MAEEKPFEPTQARLEKAKREGDSARSQELSGVAAFAAALLTAAAVAHPLAAAAARALALASAGEAQTAALATVAELMLLPAACAAVVSCMAAALQGGGVRFTPVTFKAARLAPAENLKRMLSRESLITALRASIAFLCAAAAIGPAFAAVFSRAMQAAGFGAIAMTAWSGALHACGIACAAGGAFAGIDYGLQRARWRKRLRMSHEEVKRDQREHDGDPLARSRRRALHRQLSRGSVRRVKDAAFVVVNPTHVAVALEYNPPAVAVPRVLVAAADEMAARVREAAAAHDIPIVENVALARALYATARPGEFIPQDTYVAVAEVVAALRKVRV